MWGVRAIRVGFMAGGLLALVAGSGCKSFLTGGYPDPATQETSNRSRWQSDFKSGGLKSEEKTKEEKTKSAWREVWYGEPGQELPERINGGIY